MTLAELAQLVGADPKWVLNALTSTGRPKRYSLDLARQLVVARTINGATGMPIARAFDLASEALSAWDGGVKPAIVHSDNEHVSLSIDLARILSSVSVRLSVLRTSYAPRQRGRGAARGRDPLRTAADWGIDLSLLAENRRKTSEERLRQLDAMVDFARSVRRVAG